MPRRQPAATQALPINRCRSRGRLLASRREYHGDRGDRRGGHPARGGYRAVRSAFGGPHVAMWKARRRSCRRFVAEPFPPHARPRITSRTRGHQRGNQLPGDATSLVTGPWRTARELEIKRLMAAPRSTASSPYRAFPRHSHRSTLRPKIRLYAIVLLGLW
jgi:hypothetical protein